MWGLSAWVPAPHGPLAKQETDPLATIVVPQGFSAPGGAQEAQGGHVQSNGTLANSDDPEPADLFEDF